MCRHASRAQYTPTMRSRCCSPSNWWARRVRGARADGRARARRDQRFRLCLPGRGGGDCRVRSGRATVAPPRRLGLLARLRLMLQVRFEFGGYYGSPEQLAFVPASPASRRSPTCRCCRAGRRPRRAPGHRRGQLAPRALARPARGLLVCPRRRVVVLVALAPGDLDSRPPRGLRRSRSPPISLHRPQLDAAPRTGCSTVSPQRGPPRVRRHRPGRRDPHPARLRGLARRGRAAALLARDRARSSGCSTSSRTTARALHEDARAPARLPRHGDAAVGRGRVRGQLHGAALALGRRAGERGGRRARHPDRRPPGARVRGDAARRRQDRHPEGDPQQARRAHRQRSSR